MRISVQWLRDFVEIDLPVPKLADLLTHAGLEVENLEERRPSFQKVVVARLEACRPHPRGDSLSVCTVNDGLREYSVVCGAPNLEAGRLVALALEGAVLPGGRRIERSFFQGIPSEGMLCSEKELGLGEDAAGILSLDPGPPLGASLESVLGEEDWILELNVTPNRPDCLSILGVAREVAALTGKSLAYPPRKEDSREPTGRLRTAVEIERPDLCPRYVAKLIAGVKIAPAPFWMRRRLEAVGQRAINNIVDVTNYVMLEMGQPLHAFDFDRLEEGRIVVRTSPAGERFVTLDGMEHSLPAEALLICDGRKPVALAGIMGGMNSEVHARTVNVLLESAYFSPRGTRRTAKQLGLSTEASLRFERGVDPNGALRAADRAAALMAELSGGAALPDTVDNYPRKIEPQKILLHPSRANRILGTDLPADQVRDHLRRLELEVEDLGADSIRVQVPTFRVDLEREIDLIEEVARLQGFQHIPVTLPAGRVSAGKRPRIQRLRNRARDLLAGFGLYEVITYSFVSPREIEGLNFPPEDPRARPLCIRNPLGEDQSVLRTTLVPGLFGVARSNFHRQNPDLKIFELGRVFFLEEGRDLPREVEHLAGILSGLREEESWAEPKEECDFFDLKGVVEGLLGPLGIEPRFTPFPEISLFHPGRAARVEGNSGGLGFLGEVHPDVREKFELKNRVFLFELDFQRVVDAASEGRSFRVLPRYPAVTRDLALIIEEEVPAGELYRTLWAANEGLLEEIRLFDLYCGHPIPPGKKSLAFRLTYRREDRTLTDREVNEFHGQLVETLAKRYGAVLR